MTQRFNFAARTAVVIVCVFGCIYLIDEWQVRKSEIDRCFHQMTYETARYLGMYVSMDEMYRKTENGNLVVYSSAERPYEALEEVLNATEEVGPTSLYLVRCTVVHSPPLLTAFVVEKFDESDSWSLINPR